MDNLSLALMVAIRAHAKQVDKQGEPYLFHILRVVEAVSSEREKILAALHDVCEDSDITSSDLERIFDKNGMFISNSVEVLTRFGDENYRDYIDNINDGHSSTWVEEIRKVKLADLRDNLGRIPPEQRETHREWDAWRAKWLSLKLRYEKAIQVLES